MTKKQKSVGFDDIYFSYPEQDGDNWYIQHVWSCGKRFTVSDGDGNHDPIASRDVWSKFKKLNALWLDYSKWVIESGGDDPLGEFKVSNTRKIKRNIVVHFSRWIGESKYGLVCKAVRSAGKLQQPQDVCKGIADFLFLKKINGRWCMEDCTMADLENAGGYLGTYYWKGQAEWSEPLKDATIRRRVLAIARRHLAAKS